MRFNPRRVYVRVEHGVCPGDYRVPLGLDPLIFGLIVGLVLGAVIEILIVLGPGRYFIAKKARKENLESLEAGEWDPALERVLEPLKEQITEEMTAIKAEIGGSRELEDFEARFTAAYTQDIQTLQTDIMTEMEKIPLRVSGIIHGREGVEEKAFRAMVVDAEAEVEGEITVMEAVAAQDPRAMQVAITQKIQKLGNDPEWQKEHQLGSLILEMGKPTLMNWVQTMTAQMQGVPAGMTPTLLAKSNTAKIYGT